MRDRLADLQRAAGPAETETDEASHEQVAVVVPDFMNDFFARVDGVIDNIRIIEELTTEVEHRHGDLLVAVNKHQVQECNDVLHGLMDRISTAANHVRRELKVIDKENKKMETDMAYPDGTLPNDVRIRLNQHASLSRKFVEVMTAYNDVQASNQKKYKDKLRREIKIVYPDLPEDKVESVIEHGTEGIFTGMKVEEAEDQLNKIRDRYQDIQALEKSLLELHEMFQDMAVLIASQGEMIDRIEYSVHNAHEYVEAARVETKKAERYQTLARHKQICIGVILLLAIVIIVAVVAAKAA